MKRRLKPTHPVHQRFENLLDALDELDLRVELHGYERELVIVDRLSGHRYRLEESDDGRAIVELPSEWEYRLTFRDCVRPEVCACHDHPCTCEEAA